MKAAAETHRQLAAAQGPLQQAGQIEMAEQRQRTPLAEAEAQPLVPFTGRAARRLRRGNRRGGHHHVVAELRPADAAAAAAIEGAVRHHHRGKGPLQVFGQPALVDAGIQVIPRQRLGAEGLQIGVAQGPGSGPVAHLQRPVAAAEPLGLNGTGPGGMGAVDRFKPGIHARSGPPGRLQHRRQAPVAPADEIFHRRKARIGDIALDALERAQLPAQQLLAPPELRRGNAVPLERRVGLGREVADREVQLQPPQVAALLLQGAAGVGDADHIGVGFTGQADHEIELHLAVAVLHGGADAPQQLRVGQPLVDDVAQALGAGFRGEGEARLAVAAKDVGDVLVEAIHPLAGQREAHVVLGEAVAQLHPHRRQGEVIGAAERQQREIAVAGAGHPLLHRLDHRLWLHIAGRAGEHAGLAETAAPGAAAADLDREPVMDGFDVGDQTHAVVGHGGGHPPQHARRQFRPQGLEGDAIGPRGIERRHVDARHMGQINQQRRAAQPGGFGLGHHQANLRQQFLAIAEGEEIKEGRVRFRVAGGGGAAGEDQRRCCRIVERQVAPLGGPQRQARQIQHLEDVGGTQLVAEAEAEDVEGGQGAAAFHREQGLALLAQALGQVGGGQIGAIAELAGDRVENRIKDDVAQVAGAHLVEIGIGEAPARLRLLPVAGQHAPFVAQVTTGAGNGAVHQLIESDAPLGQRRGRGDRGGWPGSSGAARSRHGHG